MKRDAGTMRRGSRFARWAQNGASALLLASLAACAEFGPTEPIMPPGPPPPTPEQISAAKTLMSEAYRLACVQTPIDLSGAEAQLVALGFQPLPPNKSWPRYGRGDVIVELRLGAARPVDASNCLVTTHVLAEGPARDVGRGALVGVPGAMLLTKEQSRELTPQGGAFGLVEAEEFDGVGSVYETVQGNRIVSILSFIKTR